MTEARYAHVPSVTNPRAVIDLRAPHPSRFFAAVVAQTLRHGLPARRRLRTVLAFLGRNGFPEAPVALIARRFPRRPRPDLDRLLEEFRTRWSDLAAASDRLPSECPPLSGLVLERRRATTIFVFGTSRHPLLVAKVPGDAHRLENELSALAEATRAGVAPRPLGKIGGAYVQEGLAGAPLRVEPLEPRTASRLVWSGQHEQLGRAFVRLAEATAKSAMPRDFVDDVVPVLERASISASTRRAAVAAWRDCQKLEVAVLRHRDTSPQNCLFEDDRFQGLVDWESALAGGVPGFDAWNAALAFLEHGAGLRRWSQERVVAIFREAWQHSGYWRTAALAARTSARAAAVREDMLDSLEVAFFASRLIWRAAAPDRYATDLRTAARMLEIACAR